jgi:hypothetical protein
MHGSPACSCRNISFDKVIPIGINLPVGIHWTNPHACPLRIHTR